MCIRDRYNIVNRVTMVLEHVFNFFDRFPHDNTSFLVVLVSTSLYQKLRLHADFHRFFALFFSFFRLSYLGAKIQLTFKGLNHKENKECKDSVMLSQVYNKDRY